MGWGRGCPSAPLSLGLARFPAVSGTGKGRQSRDVIREGGGVPVEIPSPDRKTMRLAVPKGERAFGGGRGGKQTQTCPDLGAQVLKEHHLAPIWDQFRPEPLLCIQLLNWR